MIIKLRERSKRKWLKAQVEAFMAITLVAGTLMVCAGIVAIHTYL